MSAKLDSKPASGCYSSTIRPSSAFPEGNATLTVLQEYMSIFYYPLPSGRCLTEFTTQFAEIGWWSGRRAKTMAMARSNFVTDTEHMDRVAGNTIIVWGCNGVSLQTFHCSKFLYFMLFCFCDNWIVIICLLAIILAFAPLIHDPTVNVISFKSGFVGKDFFSPIDFLLTLYLYVRVELQLWITGETLHWRRRSLRPAF